MRPSAAGVPTHRARGDGGFRHRAGQLRERHVVAHARLEHLRGHVLRAQQRVVVGLGERAVGLERGNRRDRVAQRLVAHHQRRAQRRVGEQALRHQLLEQRLARLGRVEGLGVDAAAERGAQPLLLLAQLLGELALRDAHAVDRGDVALVAERTGVGLQPEEGEGNHHQHKHHLGEALVFLYEVEHAG